MLPSPSLILSLILASAALAQEAQPTAPAENKPSEVASTPVKPPEKLMLKEGADLNLKFAQHLSSKTSTEDDPVNLVLDQDLKIGNVVIAKAGAKAVGTILQYLLVGDTRVKLRGSKDKEGQGKEGTMIALTVSFGPIGLVKLGKNVDIKEGRPLLACTDENYELPASK